MYVSVNYFPYKEGNQTMVPLQLLISIFGLSMKWDENGDNFTVRREKKEIRFEKNKYILNGKEVVASTFFAEENPDGCL